MICNRRAVDIRSTFTQIKYRFDRTQDGGATLDPDSVCEAVFACIDGALQASGRVSVTHVVVDTFVSSLMGVDSEGKPTTPLYTWSDGRGVEYAAGLNARLERGAYLQRTGTYVHPSYWPLRLEWLRETALETLVATRRWLSLGAYLMLRIVGQPVMSLSDAAWTGLLNRHRLAWDAETLSALDIMPESLPEIHSRHEVGYGPMAAGFSRRWPALRAAHWHPAIGDGVASNVGAGCTGPDQVALALGTSGAMRVIVAGTPARVPDGLFCYRIDAERSLIGGPLSNAGSVYDWLIHTLRIDAPDVLESALADMQPASHGLTVLPFLAPERSPYWDESIPSVLTGMTAATTPLDILRAHLEAVAYGFGRIASRMMPLLPETLALTASGAAVARSPVLMQILADVLGHPIAAAPLSEATIRGAVLFQTGESVAADAPARVYTPDATRTAIYAEAMARQQRLLAKFQAERE